MLVAWFVELSALTRGHERAYLKCREEIARAHSLVRARDAVPDLVRALAEALRPRVAADRLQTAFCAEPSVHLATV